MSSSSASRCFMVVVAVLFAFTVIAYALYVACTNRPSTDGTQSSTKGPRAVSSLKFVAIVTRHGNRRPLFSFTNDPYPDRYWECELGEITRQGKVEMYNMGMKIRSLYNGFLNSSYSSNDFYATSTALERTLVSAEALLAGLYPPTGLQVWNKNIPWQPIPIYSDPDESLINHYPCPRYNNETAQLLMEVYKKNAAVISQVEAYLLKYTGSNSTEITNLYRFWDTFFSEETEGFILPEWTKQVYPEPLSNLMCQEFVAISAGTDTITRIVSSEMFIQIVRLMEGKIISTLTPDYKMYFYSGHDITIIALQDILGIPKSSITCLVNPGSSMIYELHQDPDTHRHYVQVLYIDGLSTDLEPVPINITDCGLSCDFQQLLNITAKFRNFTSEEDECFKS